MDDIEVCEGRGIETGDGGGLTDGESGLGQFGLGLDGGLVAGDGGGDGDGQDQGGEGEGWGEGTEALPPGSGT